MEKIDITFLGTGNAIPTAKRNHTSILLSYKDENILIDCGEGTQRQFRYAKISPSKITRILITHWHGDHVLGLPGLLQTLAMSDYNRKLYLYGPKGTINYINLLKKLVNIKIDLEVIEPESKVFENEEFHITSSKMNHDTPCLAYSFQIKDKLRLDKNKIKKLKLPNSPLLGQLQKGKSIKHNGKTISPKSVAYLEKGRKITFILDTAKNPNAEKLAKNSSLLICESTFSSEEEEIAKEYKHLTSKQAATIAKKSKSEALILTHISQRYEHDTSEILRQAKTVFLNTRIAKDLDIVEF